ncbi:SDR family oxidoreductase [Myceligenerans salitolerans]|uniref:SDR family oxidoreductase n=1 Tax=Myceligenerans salitolerans TaxID=1230528 RepID=A0ABS3I7C9_9MICO|nr:SDR family NAD(P)-dependent oxidoreductase [Myceligenerans salitolerans]MBO0608536.1 SDR family oxidoreductase [Myceligenerans salitolerans]
MNTAGNTIFVPGATSGIGLALAQRLQAAGNTVVIGGRRTELLDELAAEHGFGTVRIDVADPGSITTATADVVTRYPDLNVLIAMAGIMRVEDWTTPGFLPDAEAVITTNVLGPVRLIAALTEHLRTRPGATVLTVSSGLAHVPLRPTPSYNASKAAIHLLSESIRLQLEPEGVRVVELVPPAVRTTLLPGPEFFEFAMPLDEFADEVMELLARRPEAHEILVERVGFLRHAETRGDYDQVVATLNGADPHAAGD